jgi:recombination protein RecT
MENTRMSTNQIMVASKPADLVSFFEKSSKQLLNALPKHIGADRMIRLAATAWSRSADLQKCDLISLFGSTLTAAQLGLELGVGGQGYLVPYFNSKKKHFEAQFIPGWQGIVDLVARAGRAVVWTGAVYRGDHFDWELGSNPRCVHKPDSDSDDWDDLEYVYAIGKINGTDMPVIEVWSKARIIRHLNKYNKVGANHYALKDGYKNFEMYARKVPLLQVMKYMPKSVEIQKAIDVAQAADAGDKYTIDGDFVVVERGDDDAVDASFDPNAAPAPAHGVRSKSQVKQPPKEWKEKPAKNSDPDPEPELPPSDGGEIDPRQIDMLDDQNSPLAGEEEIKHLLAKIDMAGLSVNDVERKFDIALENVTSQQCATILAWVKEQV